MTEGGEGAWVPIADSVYGYNQVGVALDSYLDEQAFKSIPVLVSEMITNTFFTHSLDSLLCVCVLIMITSRHIA